MFQLIIMIVLIIWGYHKLKKWGQDKGFDIDNSNIKSPQGDTVTIKEYEEIESEGKNEDNLEKLNEIKETVKKSIIFHVKQENLEEAMELLSQLEVIINNIDELESMEKESLSVKAKKISKKILDKFDDYLN